MDSWSEPCSGLHVLDCSRAKIPTEIDNDFSETNLGQKTKGLANQS